MSDVPLPTRASIRRASGRPQRIDPAQAYSVDETCAASDISRALFYKLVKAGQLKIIKAMGRTRVSGAEIIRLNSGAA